MEQLIQQARKTIHEIDRDSLKARRIIEEEKKKALKITSRIIKPQLEKIVCLCKNRDIIKVFEQAREHYIELIGSLGNRYESFHLGFDIKEGFRILHSLDDQAHTSHLLKKTYDEMGLQFPTHIPGSYSDSDGDSSGSYVREIDYKFNIPLLIREEAPVLQHYTDEDFTELVRKEIARVIKSVGVLKSN